MTIKQENFLKNNEAILREIFEARIEFLKEELIFEEDPVKRENARNFIKEFKLLLNTLSLLREDKNKKKDSFV